MSANVLKINRSMLSSDMMAGLIAAVAAIPDGLATGVLAGVNPVYGLYNLMFGTPVAALFTSSVYMAMINTSAMALVVFEAMEGYAAEEQVTALVTLTLLTGLFQLSLGLLKLDFLTRFISNSENGSSTSRQKKLSPISNKEKKCSLIQTPINRCGPMESTRDEHLFR